MTTLSLRRPRALSISVPRPELAALLVLAGVLYLWALDRNGFANEYYSAAVRSMSESWHAFLYGAFDTAGVMTVDKPPLALWAQAASVRLFGFSSWSMLAPQALMGVATVALGYDLTRRRFGRGRLRRGPRARADARHRRDLAAQQPGRAAGPLRHGRGVGDRAGARGRPHALGRPGRRVRRPGLRGEDGGRAARRAGARCGLPVRRAAGPRGRAAVAGRRRGGDDRRRARLA